MVKNISAEEAFRMIENDSLSSYLIDVRTDYELKTIGKPDLSHLGKEVCFIDILELNQKNIEEEFAKMMDSKLSSNKNLVDKKEGKFFFICKSGGRSLAAANIAHKLGYKNCFNIEGGFEGSSASNSKGWKEANLAWN
jgi:rhodanese-related sulfurtransferase